MKLVSRNVLSISKVICPEQLNKAVFVILFSSGEFVLLIAPGKMLKLLYTVEERACTRDVNADEKLD